MIRLRATQVAVGLLSLGVLLATSNADARSVGGLQARATNPAQANCLQVYGNGIRNSCGPIAVTASATLDSYNVNYNPSVYVYADSSTSCRAVGWRADMGWMWTSGYHAGNTDYYGAAIWSGIPGIGATWVPAGGGLAFECNLAAGAVISSFGW